MLNAAAVVLACLYLARASPAAETHISRTHVYTSHTSKELGSVLASIEERLRTLDTINSAQVQYARRLDVLQDKLDRVETTLSLRLERAQLAAERLEHRLHMLQTTVQASVEDSSKRLERSETTVAAIATNLTNHLISHRHLLEKVSGAYVETWRRGVTLENLMKDGLSLVNATRRELADGLRTLARRQRDHRLSSADLEGVITRRLNDNTYRVDLKIQELLEQQKQIFDSCQRVQRDDPYHVADVLDKLIDSLINKTASTFRELQGIQTAIRNHDTHVMKILNTGRTQQTDLTCRRLESAFRNATPVTVKNSELQQLTEKFVALTDRADAALQRLETRLSDSESLASSADADSILLKLKSIKSDQELDAVWDDDETSYFNDRGEDDITKDDKSFFQKTEHFNEKQLKEASTMHPLHRRHLHKHPYDRGPIQNSVLP